MAETPVSKQKIHWSNFAQEEITMMYASPLISGLENRNSDIENVCENYVKSITELIPANVKSARKQCKAAFDSWKNNDFNTTGEIHDDYRSKRKEYRSLLRDFFNQLEVQKIDRLCTAAETDEKLFGKLLKGRRNSSQMHAFLVEGKFLSDVDEICDMWANHFEALGTPSASSSFDNDFYDRVTSLLPLEKRDLWYLIDYEHVLFAGLPLWNHLCCLFQEFFLNSSICLTLKTGITLPLFNGKGLFQEFFLNSPICLTLKTGIILPLFNGKGLFQEFFLNGPICLTLKTGIILPLFNGKGAKANNKENYGGITLFLTLCKIYETILLNRLKNYASHHQYFSEMQFGFQEGVGCIEASFAIIETLNYMLERGSKIFDYFLDIRKAFDTVWIAVLLYKLFTELGIKGRMWVAIKDLYGRKSTSSVFWLTFQII